MSIEYRAISRRTRQRSNMELGIEVERHIKVGKKYRMKRRAMNRLKAVQRTLAKRAAMLKFKAERHRR